MNSQLLQGMDIHTQFHDDSGITEQGILELLKSLQANEGVTDLTQLTGASALQPQSLEASVVSLLYDESFFKAIKRIPKAKEYSTLAEYTVRDDYGSYNRGGFVGQSENPRQADPDFKRKTKDIKFIRELWSISSVLAASRTITNAEVESVDAATFRLMETWERGTFFADNSIISKEWDGIDAQIEKYAVGDRDVVVDMRGGSFTESILKESCKKIADRKGLANDMYMGYNVQNQIDNLLSPSDNQRYSQNMGNLTFDLGYSIPGFKATFALNGRVTFIPDYFIKPEEEGVPMIKNSTGVLVEGATSDMAPQTPSFVLADVAVAGSEVSKWSDSASVGPSGVAYKYRISAINQQGASKAAAEKQITPTAGQKITITITDNSVTNLAEGYILYREIKTATGVIRKMKRIAATAGGVTVYSDLNDDLPGTSLAYLGDYNSRGAEGPLRTIRFKELAPVHKTRYAVVGPYFWGAVNYYATLILYAPQKFIKFKNVGVGLV